MTEVNTKFARVRPIKQEISETLSYQDNVIFTGQGEVTDIHGKNNQDGTQDLTYTINPKIIKIEKSKIEGGEAKDITSDYKTSRKSASQTLRQKAYRIAQDTGDDADVLYQRAIDVGSEWLDQYKDEQIETPPPEALERKL